MHELHTNDGEIYTKYHIITSGQATVGLYIETSNFSIDIGQEAQKNVNYRIQLTKVHATAQQLKSKFENQIPLSPF